MNKIVHKKITSLSIPKSYSLLDDGLTQSLITAYTACPARFALKLNGYCNGSKANTFFFGSLVHEVLDRCYSSNIFEAEFIEQCIEEFCEEEKKNLAVDEQVIENDSGLAYPILVEYFKFWEDADKKFAFDKLEEEFAYDVDGITHRGKIDGRYNMKNKRWIMEHKTKSRISENNLQMKLSFDFQNNYYIKAAEVLDGCDITGVLYNVLRKPQLKRRKNDTLKMFVDRVTEDIQSRPEFYFMRWEIPVTKREQKVFSEELKIILDDIRKTCSGEKKIYRNRASCESPFPCEYLENCAINSVKGMTINTDLFSELNFNKSEVE